MDAALIESALRKAMAAGASAAPPMNQSAQPSHDINLITAQTVVGISAEGWSAFISDLQRDPHMKRFDEMFATSPIGGEVRVSLDLIAKLLLANAISSGDITQTVSRFMAYLDKNHAPVMAVMTVRGIRADEEVALGPDIRLVPIKSLPPSVQRGALMGQPSALVFAKPVPRSALIEFEYGPVFYRDGSGRNKAIEEAQANFENAIADLDQARCLFSLAGLSTASPQWWVQPTDWLMSAGVSAATFLGEDSPLLTDALIYPGCDEAGHFVFCDRQDPQTQRPSHSVVSPRTGRSCSPFRRQSD
jgi:hypothetical protein